MVSSLGTIICQQTGTCNFDTVSSASFLSLSVTGFVQFFTFLFETGWSVRFSDFIDIPWYGNDVGGPTLGLGVQVANMQGPWSRRVTMPLQSPPQQSGGARPRRPGFIMIIMVTTLSAQACSTCYQMFQIQYDYLFTPIYIMHI